jgi:hypothetical protein
VKLSGLHISQVGDLLLSEAFDPGKEEKLAYLQMMIAKQGKQPDKIIDRIRGMIDPEHAKRLGAKASFERWVNGALPGESKVGRTFGRKVKVTVLESEIKQMLTEGFFSDVGDIIMSKLRNLLGDDRKEHALVTQALDKHPGLAAIHRYAQRADKALFDDPGFWELINKVTAGKGKEIERMVKGTFKRIMESKHGLFTECIIVEARMTEVMRDLGLDQDTIQGMMDQFDLRDDDYDLARMRDALMRAKGKVEDAVKYMRELPARGLEKAGEVVKDVGAKVSEIEPLKRKRMQDENIDLADYVVTMAAMLMDVREADARTPAQVANVVDKATERADVTVVGPEDVGVNI